MRLFSPQCFRAVPGVRLGRLQSEMRTEFKKSAYEK